MVESILDDDVDTTDLTFGMYPLELTASERDELYSDFEKFAGSSAAMNTIVFFDTVMDEVSASETAMDAVIASELALDKVVESETAMDAVAASETAMDAVAASETAMDAVAASETAMDAVVASIMAITAALSSGFAVFSLWSTELASTTIWEAGDPTPPHDYGSVSTELISGPTGDGQALRFSTEDRPSDVNTWDLTLDLTDADQLSLQTANSDGSGTRRIIVRIGGDEIFSSGSTHSFTERTLDVSSFTGEHDVQVGTDHGSFEPYNGDFADIQLE